MCGEIGISIRGIKVHFFGENYLLPLMCDVNLKDKNPSLLRAL